MNDGLHYFNHLLAAFSQFQVMLSSFNNESPVRRDSENAMPSSDDPLAVQYRSTAEVRHAGKPPPLQGYLPWELSWLRFGPANDAVVEQWQHVTLAGFRWK